MTMVPHVPLWCWNLLGEDAVYLSQPTLSSHGPSVTPIDGAGACVARCTFASRLGEVDGSAWTYDIQCARVARLTADGEYRCLFHHPQRWESCAWCDELQAAGSPKSCPGCHAIWRETGLPDFCCPPEDPL